MPQNADAQKHILAINDDIAILQLFDDLLTEAGYTVTLGNFQRQTSELMDIVRELKPDLILMDFVMGSELSGWQLLQATRMDRSTRELPVVICTGAVKQVNELGAHLDSMGVSVVIKPFDIDHLLAVIEKVWDPHTAAGFGLHTPGLEQSTGAPGA